MDDDQRRIDDEPEDEDVEAHKKQLVAAEEQGEDTDGDDDFELHRKAASQG